MGVCGTFLPRTPQRLFGRWMAFISNESSMITGEIPYESIPVAVNLAPVTLADPSFPAFAYRLPDSIPGVYMVHESGIRMVFDDIHRYPPLPTVLPTIPHDGANMSYHAVATIRRDLRAIYRHHDGHRMIGIEDIETFAQDKEPIRWMSTPWLQGYVLHRPLPVTDPRILPPHPALDAMEQRSYSWMAD